MKYNLVVLVLFLTYLSCDADGWRPRPRPPHHRSPPPHRHSPPPHRPPPHHHSPPPHLPPPHHPPWPHHPPPPRRPPFPPVPRYDYFKLVLQWPNSFCSAPDTKCHIKATPQAFTIYGLWPEKYDGRTPIYCHTLARMTDNMLEELKEELLQYWPHLLNNSWEESKQFWKFQWDRHGSCSSYRFTPKQYLQHAINLAKGHTLRAALARRGIIPSASAKYKPEDIQSAVQSETKVWPALECNHDRNHRNQLFHIVLCFEADGRAKIDCYRQIKNCNVSGVYYPAGSSTLLPNSLGSESQTQNNGAEEQ